MNATPTKVGKTWIPKAAKESYNSEKKKCLKNKKVVLHCEKKIKLQVFQNTKTAAPSPKGCHAGKENNAN